MAISFPGSLTLARDVQQEQALLARTRSLIEKGDRQPGVHASGLLDPRQEFWKQKDPQPLDNREVMTFFVGKVLHAFILGAAKGEKELQTTETDEGSTFSEPLGIWYSPDFNRNGLLAELKTSRSQFEPKTARDIDSYIEQLLVYMAAENKTEAQVWVLYLSLKDKETNRTQPEYRVYTIRMTPQDLEAVKREVKSTAEAVVKAVQTGNFRELPLCRTWKCRPDMCHWWDKCQPEGRWKKPAGARG